MFTRLIGILALVPIALICVGCERASVAFNYYDDHPRPVHVARVVHAPPPIVVVDDCPDCYWDGTRVVVIAGHRHGPGCGHIIDGDRWVVVRGAHVVPAHRPARVTRVRPIH